MDVNAVYARTARGEEELRTRANQLRAVQRQALILIDGRSPLIGVLDRWGSLTGLPEALLFLEDNGFIAPLTSAGNAADPANGTTTADHVRGLLLGLVESLVPKGNARMVAKLKDAPGSHDGLQAAVESCYKLMRLTVDEGLAEKFFRRARGELQRL
jgi:hypothetical protein